jgi:BolA family transcriptional regulator, general stress-responsive regulator
MTDAIGPVAREIAQRLTNAFAPRSLQVIDDSHQHRGHGGHREGIETHLTVIMAAEQLAPLSRVARQRAVLDALADLMDNPVHALSLKLSA